MGWHFNLLLVTLYNFWGSLAASRRMLLKIQLPCCEEAQKRPWSKAQASPQTSQPQPSCSSWRHTQQRWPVPTTFCSICRTVSKSVVLWKATKCYRAIDNWDTPVMFIPWARTVNWPSLPRASTVGHTQLLQMMFPPGPHQPRLCTFCSPFMEWSLLSHSSHTHHCLPGGLLLSIFNN